MRKHSQEFKLSSVKRVEAGESATAVARELKLSPSLLSKWLKDYRARGLEGLQNKSSRPHHQPKKTSQWIIDKVLKLKRSKPELGIAAASEHLARFEAVDLRPTPLAKYLKVTICPTAIKGQPRPLIMSKVTRIKRPNVRWRLN